MVASLKTKIEINFDIEEMSEKYIEAAYKAMAQLATAAEDEWKAEAGRKLTRTKQDYQDSIQIKEISPGNIEIYMEEVGGSKNKVARMLEGGAPEWNVADKILAKIKNKGKKRKKPAWAFNRTGSTVWVDVPLYLPGNRSGQPSMYRRITDKTRATRPGLWWHPGFKPVGEGGLDAPLRDHVVEWVKEEAPEIFNKILSSVKV